MTFTLRRQLTVALENEPGRLASISRLLANSGVTIDGLCVIDNIEQGVVRILPSDADVCHDHLTSRGFYVVESEILAVNLSNMHGILARVTEALAHGKVNIDYAYVTAARDAGYSMLAMKVSDLPLAESILEELAFDGSLPSD
ncbi:MAG: amino acid-binding protein [Verrucomicrobia bacterium]|nr:MAG: amino acid-binding protein [Verrucomicrobiota bacterium]